MAFDDRPEFRGQWMLPPVKLRGPDRPDA